MQAASPGHHTEQSSKTGHRLHGLDALRGVAAVLVVLLHAGIPYMTHPFPHLVWPARDAQPSAAVDALTWCSEGFLMPLFFVLGGFFAQMQLAARGERCFLEARTRRLLWTQFAASFVILPICLNIWAMGWMADELFVPKDIFMTGIPPELEADLWGTAHIWFLQNLYIYSVLLCGVHCWARLRPQQAARLSPIMRLLDNTLISVLKPLLPVIPAALVLYYDPRIVLGFYQSWFPIVSKLAYYGVYFFLGAMLHRNHDALRHLSQYGKTYLVLAALLFSVTLPRINEHVANPLTGIPLASLAGLLALFASFATFGLIATFVKLVRDGNAATRYLAEASFWVYLIHLPLVVLIQIDMARLPIPTVAKFALTGAGALTLALITYHLFVRTTWLGEFLNGYRVPRKTVAAPALPPEPVLSPEPVLGPEVVAPWLSIASLSGPRPDVRSKGHGTRALGRTT